MALPPLISCACAYRGYENIVIEAIIIPELELRNVKMQILFADIVEGADDSTFDERPKALNRIGVNGTNNAFLCSVINGGVRIALLAETMVANPLVCTEQAYFVRDSFTNERFQRRRFDVGNHASDDIALAANCASDDSALATRSRTRQTVALVSVFVLGLAADESFVNFDDTAELGFGFDQGGADFVSHQPSGFDRAKAHVAAKLACAHAFLAGQDQVSDLEPVAQRLVGVLKDRPGKMGKPIAVQGALFALPMMAGSERIHLVISAARANHALGPTARNQIANTGIFVTDREPGVELGGSHLMDGLGTLPLPARGEGAERAGKRFSLPRPPARRAGAS
jgi:hypothetical protein